jgi:hypothetical protein
MIVSCVALLEIWNLNINVVMIQLLIKGFHLVAGKLFSKLRFCMSRSLWPKQKIAEQRVEFFEI